MHPKLNNAILKTLCYSDIFDYPLKTEEIWKFLVIDRISFAIDYLIFSKELDYLQKVKKISFQKGFYCLKGREGIIKKRIEKREINAQKLQKAKKVANYLSKIPTISFIGVSGSLAVANAEKDDDIDIFIIAKGNFLWITRLLVSIILELLHVRRKPRNDSAPNLICSNMFLSENALRLPESLQNFYSAHEVVQVKPLVDKSNMLKKFLKANSWVTTYLPHAIQVSSFQDVNIGLFEYWLIWIFWLLEPFARLIQLAYMKKKITTETISNSILAFHPVDYKSIILKKYEGMVKKILR